MDSAGQITSSIYIDRFCNHKFWEDCFLHKYVSLEAFQKLLEILPYSKPKFIWYSFFPYEATNSVIFLIQAL